MNGFLKGVMSTLLGWLNPLLSSAWGVFTGRENLLTFLGKNWKGLVLILCLLGILIDLLVYLFRWKPWRVWLSFWQRIRHPAPLPAPGDAREVEEAPPAPEAAPLYAEGAPLYAEEPGPNDTAPEEPPRWETPEEAAPVRRRRRRQQQTETDGYYEPYYPPQWQEPGTLGAPRRPGE